MLRTKNRKQNPTEPPNQYALSFNKPYHKGKIRTKTAKTPIKWKSLPSGSTNSKTLILWICSRTPKTSKIFSNTFKLMLKIFKIKQKIRPKPKSPKMSNLTQRIVYTSKQAQNLRNKVFSQRRWPTKAC